MTLAYQRSAFFSRNAASWLVIGLTAIALVALYNGILIHEAARLRPTDYVTGLTHIDLLVYYACAREPWDSGSFFYASPYSSQPNSPRIYSHLGFYVIGLVWRGFNLTVYQTDLILRTFFGTAMLIAGAAVFRFALPVDQRNRPISLAATMLVICGGGIAWLSATLQTLLDWAYGRFFDDSPVTLGRLFAGWAGTFAGVEGGYGEWGASLPRVLFSVPECIYHLLFFLCMLALLTSRLWIAVLFVFLTWWAHPFTGVMLGSIVFLYLAFRITIDRACIAPCVTVLAIHLGFLAYYFLFLPRFPEHASVASQMHEFGAVMLARKMLPAYGLFLLLPLLLMRRVVSRPILWRPATLLMTVWLGCELLLIFHDRFVHHSFQPMHFTRGYLYFPLVYFSLQALQNVRLLEPWRNQVLAASSLLALHLPDTGVYFTLLSPRIRELRVGFTIDYETATSLQMLDKLPETLTLHALRSAELSGTEYWIPVLTHHRALLPHTFNVPLFERKRALAVQPVEVPPILELESFQVDALIADAKTSELLTSGSMTPPSQLSDGIFLVRLSQAR